MEAPKWTAYSPLFKDEYFRFARKQYGPHAYQATANYLEWLYERNEHSKGFSDFLIGTLDSGEVIGCIHKMRLPWRIKGSVEPFATLHNLMLKSTFRSGYGYWLLRRSLQNENHLLIQGVARPFSEVYREMKCQVIAMAWFYKTLRTLRLLGRHVLHRTGLFADTRRSLELPVSGQCCTLKFTTRPTPDEQCEIAVALNQSKGEDHVEWSPGLVSWRFFDSIGPRHIFARPTDSSPDFIILSLGIRHGILVARIITLFSPSGEQNKRIRQAILLARYLGADVILAVTQDALTLNALKKTGFSKYRKQPETFIFNRIKEMSLKTLFGPEASDLGFEAIPPD